MRQLLTAVLLDTVSIQKYIFISNRLKDNLGASHIVKSIYEEPLKKALASVFKENENAISNTVNKWHKLNDTAIDDGDEFGVGYIGGGNALLFFKNCYDAKNFVSEWSRLLLIEAPGLQTAVSIKEDIDLTENFQDSIKNIYKQLVQNKSKFHPVTLPYKFGITADCSLSDNSADIWYKDEEKYISAHSFAKIKKVDEATDALIELYREEIDNRYTFTKELDKLGQKEGEENYIAVVHIDGNSIGKRFEECRTLAEKRKLSIDIAFAVEQAFKKLLEHIIMLIDSTKLSLKNGFNIQIENDGKKILPIRPIIIEGDDITFVCDGRLGVHFAEKFIEYYTKQAVADNKPLSACVGISIAKTKYPFYRVYKLAEELCQNAKKKTRERNQKDTSWLDFHIAYGGFSGSLEEIRERHFTLHDLVLNFGPYKLIDENDEKYLGHLKNGVKELNKFPRSLRKKLRTALSEGTKEMIMINKELEAKGLVLPKIPHHKYEKNGYIGKITPYFDMMELMEFYPGELIDE